jgi:hypothetical protein
MQAKLLQLVRDLRAADDASGMPQSAIQKMTDVVDDKMMSDIVNDLKGAGTTEPGWIKQSPGKPRERSSGSGMLKFEDRTKQFEQFDAMVDAMVGTANDTSKLR